MVEDIKKMVEDKFLREQCNNFTRFHLQHGMCINKIALFIKDYTIKYNYIKKNMSPKMWEQQPFTMELWWSCGARGSKFVFTKIGGESYLQALG